MQHGCDQLGCSGDAVSQVRKIHLFAVAHGNYHALLRTAGNLGKLGRHFTLRSGEQHDLTLDHGSKFVLADTNLVVALCSLAGRRILRGQEQIALRYDLLLQDGADQLLKIFTFTKHGNQYILRHNIISFTGQYKYKSNYTHKQPVSQRILQILFAIHHFD